MSSRGRGRSRFPSSGRSSSGRGSRASSARPRLSIAPTPPSRASPASSQSSQSSHSSQNVGLQHGEHVEDDEDDDMLNEIILAVSMQNDGTIGCAYYVAIDEVLYLQEDIPMAGVDLVETLLLFAQPTTVLVSHSAPEAMAEYLQRGARGSEDARRDSGLLGLQGAYQLRNIRNAEFAFDGGREKLVNLDLEMFGRAQAVMTSVVEETDGAGSYVRNRAMRLATIINMDSRASIGCANAVLNDLNRRKSATFFPDDPDAFVRFRVKEVRMFALNDSMFVNADTLASLQILQSEAHPNGQMQGPGKSKSASKESLSVYGLLQSLAGTPQGKTRLRQIFLRPSVNLDEIQERQRTIGLLLHPENSQTLGAISKILKKIKNIRRSVLLLRKGVDLPSRNKNVGNSVWLALLRFSRHAIELIEVVASLVGGEEVEIVRKIHNKTDPRKLLQAGELILQVVDFDESKISRRTVVRAGVSEALDELKRTYHGLGDFLSKVAGELVARLPQWAVQYVQSCHFMPQLGFLVAVQVDANTHKGCYEGEGLENDEWVAMFQSEDTVYYKNKMMRDLDREVGDIYCRLVDMEIDILHDLGVKMLEGEENMVVTSDLFGELDSLVALALGAHKYGWTAPQMTTANVIDIEEGRHALQELTVPAFMPNPCLMVGGCGSPPQPNEAPSPEATSMLVLTGPNHSGKSIYLKQVALIVYLAHLGSYVPASSAIIGLTDAILTRIATRESVSHNESAFAIDLRQAAFSINFATRRSLVLVDEFGKGTIPTDGAGLAAALLRHFLDCNGQQPKVLVATHFHEIFECGFLNDAAHRPALAHMQVHVDAERDEDDQVVFLFRLVAGRSASSFGTRCAAQNGVCAAVIDRAEAISLLQVRNEDLERACAVMPEKETRALEAAEAMARLLLDKDVPVVAHPRRSGVGAQGGTPVRDMLGAMAALDGGDVAEGGEMEV